MMMIMIMIMIIHNNIKECNDGKMVCHKTKNDTERTRRMKVTNTVMVMMVSMLMMLMVMMTRMMMEIAMTTMELRSSVMMDDWRSYSDQKVDKLRRLSYASPTNRQTDGQTDRQTDRQTDGPTDRHTGL
mgnify:CR=1 FL=1